MISDQAMEKLCQLLDRYHERIDELTAEVKKLSDKVDNLQKPTISLPSIWTAPTQPYQPTYAPSIQPFVGGGGSLTISSGCAHEYPRTYSGIPSCTKCGQSLSSFSSALMVTNTAQVNSANSFTTHALNNITLTGATIAAAIPANLITKTFSTSAIKTILREDVEAIELEIEKRKNECGAV